MQLSTKIILVATLMLLAGAVFPFLMVAKFIEPSFWLSFVSYAGSVGGLLVGMYGIAMRMMSSGPKDDWEDWRGL